jgi:hypothetical protein
MSDPYGPPYDPNRGYGQPNQPGQGGGYGNESYGNQGYGGTPGYGNQGYPEPGSGGGYSGYPQQQPQSPAPGSWGSPAAQDPYQQQPNAPTSYGGYQTYPDPYSAPPAPPPPPRKSKGPLIAVLVIVALLLVCGIGGAVLLLANKKGTPTATGTGTTTGATSGATTAAPPPATKISFQSPATIGVLKKSGDQTRADSLKGSMSGAGIEDPFAVMYDDTTSKGRLAIAWGGTGSAFGGGDPGAQLDGFFSSAGSSLGSGATVETRQNADPGSVGGKAQCAKVDGTGVVMTMCAWASDNALLGFIISGLTVDKAATRMQQMLQAIVVKS